MNQSHQPTETTHHTHPNSPGQHHMPETTEERISAHDMQALLNNGQATEWQHNLIGQLPDVTHYRNTWWYRGTDNDYRPASGDLNHSLTDFDARLRRADNAIAAARTQATP